MPHHFDKQTKKYLAIRHEPVQRQQQTTKQWMLSCCKGCSWKKELVSFWDISQFITPTNHLIHMHGNIFFVMTINIFHLWFPVIALNQLQVDCFVFSALQHVFRHASYTVASGLWIASWQNIRCLSHVFWTRYNLFVKCQHGVILSWVGLKNVSGSQRPLSRNK